MRATTIEKTLKTSTQGERHPHRDKDKHRGHEGTVGIDTVHHGGGLLRSKAVLTFKCQVEGWRDLLAVQGPGVNRERQREERKREGEIRGVAEREK